MAKSTRSKVKRAYRAKKREEGTYAAAEASRLHRLHAKLVSLASKDKDGDVQVEEDGDGEGLPGWCWFAVFGLLDASNVTTANLHRMKGRSSRTRRRKSRRRRGCFGVERSSGAPNH